ncbi:MAG: hypothetical protein C0490_16445 [Marivirga sp.]|nr:hypothetical protein [Marivirga sp.]
MGNHLLENGFSLLFGAYYFQNEKFYKIAIEIIDSELNEQVLNDGAHFELSPMYHQILLFRLLDCVNLVKNNKWKNGQFLARLNQKATLMLGWLKATTFLNGEIPLVNDAAAEIAPKTTFILEYADRLGIKFEAATPNESGYRMIRSGAYELFLDVGNIGPDYIPGHAHSDTLSYLLCVDRLPVIVDVGISTYENCPTRHYERSTMAHNTVMVNNQQQSEIWSSFRVGRRAKIIQREEFDSTIAASHDGYKSMGITHKRTWSWEDTKIVVEDELPGTKPGDQSISYLHFHPDVEVIIDDNGIRAGKLKVNLTGHKKYKIVDYNFALGYNRTKTGKVLEIYFNDRLKTILSIAQ